MAANVSATRTCNATRTQSPTRFNRDSIFRPGPDSQHMPDLYWKQRATGFSTFRAVTDNSRGQFSSPRDAKAGSRPSLDQWLRHFFFTLRSSPLEYPRRVADLPRRQRQCLDPSQHGPQQTPREVAFRQQQPIVAGMLDQPPTRLHQPLLQAGQRPVVDFPCQDQPPAQVPQIVGNHAQPQPDLVRAEPMATQPCHLDRLLSFLDPLLRRSSLVIEPRDRPARQGQVRIAQRTAPCRRDWPPGAARRRYLRLAAVAKPLLGGE